MDNTIDWLISNSAVAILSFLWELLFRGLLAIGIYLK